MTMRCRSFQRAEGFTLIELLIAMSIFLLVLLGIYQVFDTNRQTYVSGTRKVDVQQNARVALDAIAREIRMAGYYPENFDSSTGNDLANPRPIQVAQNNGVAMFGAADAEGVSKIFLYCLNGTDVIRKWTKLAAGTVTGPAQAYTCSVENFVSPDHSTDRVGDVLAENIATLQFTYYDGGSPPGSPPPLNPPTPIPNPATLPYTLDSEGMGSIPPFASTAQRGAVRIVVITLVATESVPIPGQQPQIFTLTSSVRLRNIIN
jgi:prepilin-type N-terminal cleavage/methylation domain-containing protein